jgi:hypothetical protein
MPTHAAPRVRIVGWRRGSAAASAERTGVGVVASFDRSIDRVGTVRREEPG